MNSISKRLLAGTAIVLAIFVLLTGLSTRYSVHKRAETALFDRLQGLVYGILGATELTDTSEGAEPGVFVNELALPEARLNLNTHGLYAELIGNGGKTLWESSSSTEVVPKVAYSPIGEWIFERLNTGNKQQVHRMQLASVWELESGEEIPFIVHVVADAELFTGQLKRFDRTLWLSLLASAATLLLLQLWILSKGLKPLRFIGDELAEIEQGERTRLSEDVPAELKPLAGSINQLLASEKNRHEQYRYLINDLAHSLKTPLSVLNNVGNSERTANQQLAATLKEQTGQMQATVERYLQRASANTAQTLSTPISPLPVLNKIVRSLDKIYSEPVRQFDIQVGDDFTVRLAELDLYEVLGNVLDNACKYGASTIRITSNTETNSLFIDDNGPGFPDGSLVNVLDRGARADTAIEGQGVGLAASKTLMQSYGGDLQLDTSPDGGARVILDFRSA